MIKPLRKAHKPFGHGLSQNSKLFIQEGSQVDARNDKRVSIRILTRLQLVVSPSGFEPETY